MVRFRFLVGGLVFRIAEKLFLKLFHSGFYRSAIHTMNLCHSIYMHTSIGSRLEKIDWNRLNPEKSISSNSKNSFFSRIQRSQDIEIKALFFTEILESASNTLFTNGEEDTATQVLQRALDWREHLAKQQGLHKKNQICLAGWSVAIGHLAHIDFLIKGMDLGIIERKKIVLLKRPHLPYANLPLALEWKRKIRVVTQERRQKLLYPQSRFLEIPPTLIKNKDGNWFPHLNLMAKIEAKWNEAGRGSLLNRRYTTDEEFERVLRKMGISANEKFITIHYRTDDYYHEKHKNNPKARSVDPVKYKLAVLSLIEKGYGVIRLGEKGSKHENWSDRYIDYPNSPWKSAIMDLNLISKSHFFIGNNSGPTFVALIYGVPTLLSNYSPLFQRPTHPRSLLMPKTYRYKNTGLKLNLKEISESSFATADSKSVFESKGVEVVDNSPEEILASVQELQDRLNTSDFKMEGDEELQEQYQQFLKSKEAYLGGTISLRFLENNPNFLQE